MTQGSAAGQYQICFDVWNDPSVGITQAQFFALNPGINCNALQSGQQLCIRGAGAPAAAPAAAAPSAPGDRLLGALGAGQQWGTQLASLLAPTASILGYYLAGGQGMRLQPAAAVHVCSCTASDLPVKPALAFRQGDLAS